MSLLLFQQREIVTNEEAAPFLILFFVLFGTIFLGVAFLLLYARRKKRNNCLEKTMAKIIEFRAVRSRGAGGHHSTLYHAVYEYYVNGMKYSQMSRYGLGKLKQNVGLEVLLHYNKENPSLFFVEEDIRISKILSTVFFAVGLGIFMLAVSLLVFL